MGHKMVAQEAINIAMALALRTWGRVPEGAFATRSVIDPSEWVVHIPFADREGYVAMDPAHAMVIVDENTRQARWFPVL